MKLGLFELLLFTLCSRGHLFLVALIVRFLLVFSEHWLVAHVVVGEIRIVERLSHLDRGAAMYDLTSAFRRVNFDVDLTDLDIHVPIDRFTRLLLNNRLYAAYVPKRAT